MKHIFKIIWTSDFKFGTLLHLGKPGGTQSSQIFTQKGASPRSRDPKSFWHTIKNVFKTAWARYFKFGTQLHLGRPSGRTNNFFRNRDVAHVTCLYWTFFKWCLMSKNKNYIVTAGLSRKFDLAVTFIMKAVDSLLSLVTFELDINIT